MQVGIKMSGVAIAAGTVVKTPEDSLDVGAAEKAPVVALNLIDEEVSEAFCAHWVRPISVAGFAPSPV